MVQSFDLMVLDGKTYKVPKNLGLVSLDFWSDFAGGFKQGFDIASKVANQAAPFVSQIAGQEWGDAYNQALPFVNAGNSVVQGFNLLNLDNKTYNGHQLQNLDFWGDFAKGF